LDDVHLNRRRLVHAQDPVGVEVWSVRRVRSSG
jgi:hypothetical protein